ncbi:MAG: DUF551 domain-containing protein, partial [Hafnia sp.]
DVDVGLQRYEGGNWFSVVQEEVMEWIKCSDKVPEDTRYVLCYQKFSKPYIAFHDGNGWVEISNYRPHPTHWMPLPAPPTE